MGYKIRRRFSKKRINKRKINKTQLKGGSNNNTISDLELDINSLDVAVNEIQTLINKLTIFIKERKREARKTNNPTTKKKYTLQAKNYIKERKARKQTQTNLIKKLRY